LAVAGPATQQNAIKEQWAIRARVAPLAPTTTGGESRISGLPGDFLEAAVRRLEITCLIYASTYLILHALGHFRRPADLTYWPIDAVAICAIGISLVFYVILRRSCLNYALALDLGLVYWVIGALGIDLGMYYALLSFGLPIIGLSWVCIWIVIFPLIVPNSPGKMLLAGLACACMGPVAYLLAKEMTGAQPAPGWDPFFVFLSYFVSVALAYVAARVIYRLGRDVHKAREMGSYELVELLGRGGMGEVWLAKHRLLTRPAAIKLVRPDLVAIKGGEAEQRAAIKRFEREAQATASLRSPHTVELYDFGVTEDGSFYYAMEFLEGLDLERLVKRVGPLPAERVVYILGQACRSLYEAHRQGIIHRDVKPGNIYLCQLGCHYDFVKVLDFGLVKTSASAEQSQTATLTKVGIVTGTPAYLAPELASGHKTIDGRSDLYSLGCVAYWLLTGQLVFEGATPLEILIQHLQESPIPPSARTELEVPEALDRIVLQCLAKDPEDRPADARVLSQLLSGCRFGRVWTEEEAERWWTLHRPARTAAR